MNESLHEKWEKLHVETRERLGELEEAGKNWIQEFDKVEQTATGLMTEIRNEMKDSRGGQESLDQAAQGGTYRPSTTASEPGEEARRREAVGGASQEGHRRADRDRVR